MRERIECAMRSAEASAQPAYPTAPVAAAVRAEACTAFFEHDGAPPGDREIVQYLAEVVKIQQMLAAGAPGTRAPPLRLDTRPCHAFVERANPSATSTSSSPRSRLK